jgi:nucleotide-binding universal stress UspA family protein
MKKILLVFDGTNFSVGAFEFARKMNEVSPILLTGIFLPQAEYANLWNYGDAMVGPLLIPVVERSEEEKMEKNVARFRKLCQDEGIDYRVHEDSFDFALRELKKETRFADLLIIGSESFYENMGIREPNGYLEDGLHGVESPVLVIPEKFDYPMTNILSYDGNKSSVYAIKQFAYLFPEMSGNPTLLVYANKKTDSEIPEEVNIEELTARHFPDLTVTKIDSSSGKYFGAWISKKKSAILISGSFGRSLFSRIFRKSFISDVIRDHKLPVFIAHK